MNVGLVCGVSLHAPIAHPVVRCALDILCFRRCTGAEEIANMRADSVIFLKQYKENRAKQMKEVQEQRELLLVQYVIRDVIGAVETAARQEEALERAAYARMGAAHRMGCQ